MLYIVVLLVTACLYIWGISGSILFFLAGTLLMLGFSEKYLTFKESKIAISPNILKNVKKEWLFVSITNFLVLMIGNSPKSMMPLHMSIHLQMMLMVFGVITWAYAFGEFHLQFRREHIMVIAIAIIAFVIRTYELENIFRNFYDELSFIGNVNLIRSDNISLLTPVNNAFSNIFPYMQYLTREAMGPSLLSLRLPSAIFGTIGIVGIYALSKHFLPKNIAFLSMFILAIFPLHIHFSRLGLNNIAGSTLGIWGFVYILNGIKSGKISDFAIGGLLFGMTHYFYEVDRLFFSAFFILWIFWICIVNKDNREIAKLSIVTVITMIVIAIPMYYTLASNGYPIFERVKETQQSVLQINPDILMQYLHTTANDVFYRSNNPQVPLIFIPCFLAGFSYLLLKIKTRGGSLLVGILVLMALGNGLVDDSFSPMSSRYVTAYSIISIVIAIGMHISYRIIQDRFSRNLKWVAVIFVAVIGFSQVQYYFNVSVKMFYEHQFNRLTEKYEPEPFIDEMILRAMQFEDQTILYIVTDAITPSELLYDVPIYYGKTETLKLIYLPKEELGGYLETLDITQKNVFTFTGNDRDVQMKINDYFPIVYISGSPMDIPDAVKMQFYYIYQVKVS